MRDTISDKNSKTSLNVLVVLLNIPWKPKRLKSGKRFVFLLLGAMLLIHGLEYKQYQFLFMFLTMFGTKDMTQN